MTEAEARKLATHQHYKAACIA